MPQKNPVKASGRLQWVWDGVRWVLSWSDPDSDPPAFDPEHSVDHSAEWEIEALRRDLDELTARVGGLEGEDGD